MINPIDQEKTKWQEKIRIARGSPPQTKQPHDIQLFFNKGKVLWEEYIGGHV